MIIYNVKLLIYAYPLLHWLCRWSHEGKWNAISKHISKFSNTFLAKRFCENYLYLNLTIYNSQINVMQINKDIPPFSNYSLTLQFYQKSLINVHLLAVAVDITDTHTVKEKDQNLVIVFGPYEFQGNFREMCSSPTIALIMTNQQWKILCNKKKTSQHPTIVILFNDFEKKSSINAHIPPLGLMKIYRPWKI